MIEFGLGVFATLSLAALPENLLRYGVGRSPYMLFEVTQTSLKDMAV